MTTSTSSDSLVARLAARASALRSDLLILLLSAAFVVSEAAPDANTARLPTGGDVSHGFIPTWDTNGDGVIARSEYDAQRASAYLATNVNRDSKLDEQEYVDESAGCLDRRIAFTCATQLRQGNVRSIP